MNMDLTILRTWSQRRIRPHRSLPCFPDWRLLTHLLVAVFQCSPDDMHLVMTPKASAPVPPPPPIMLPQRPAAFVPNIPGLLPMSAPMFWPYPSPPVSPNMIIPGQVNQLVVYGIGPNVGLADIIAHFQTPDVVVENVMFTRIAQGNIPGEAVVTVRSADSIGSDGGHN
ncbi:mRNA splicing factor that regulates alternative splicing of many proteins in embryo [Parelaphostrongylus tenuis]|uniref:mRNA splicing factor that regulates alternative splicing of many proteins in embryo n=1 Tax=Parelaphostrongylus tenuis TaxID=148309 RepID=A0AAD5QSL1_PARTN|nr:mRNA splicing factor that regulates alternative splicing of many proteins in embryo [Parelaphostrongylus tenuis]